MKSARLSLEKHFSCQLKEEDLQEDTLVLTMDVKQKKKILAEFQNTENVYTFSEFVETK